MMLGLVAIFVSRIIQNKQTFGIKIQREAKLLFAVVELTSKPVANIIIHPVLFIGVYNIPTGPGLRGCHHGVG